MFERFTTGGRQTVVLAQEEARDLQHDYIGTEHLLLGLLRVQDGVAARVLQRMGVSTTEVRAGVVGAVGRGAQSPPGHIPFTPRAKKVLELSLREALSLGHNYIGTEHILLGLVREGEGLAAQVLVTCGVALERLRAAVIEELGAMASGAAPAAPNRRRHTPAAEDALALADGLAADTPTGSHHLLEALARTPDGVAAKALAALGVDAEAVAAAIDEIGTADTADVTPEVEAAARMEIRLEGDEVHLVLRDATSREVVQAMVEPLGGPVRGDDPATGSLVALWESTLRGLGDVRRRVAPDPPLPEEAASSRTAILRQAVQSRLARRRAR